MSIAASWNLSSLGKADSHSLHRSKCLAFFVILLSVCTSAILDVDAIIAVPTESFKMAYPFVFKSSKQRRGMQPFLGFLLLLLCCIFFQGMGFKVLG
jgi:hypothetical protein